MAEKIHHIPRFVGDVQVESITVETSAGVVTYTDRVPSADKDSGVAPTLAFETRIIE